jgi:2-dehydropantoate 2-reductase
MKQPKIAVVGAGPVGSILVAYLVRGGNNVTIVDVLEPYLAAVRAQGLHIDGFTSFHVPVESTFASIDAAAGAGERFDVVFACVKGPVNQLIAGSLPSITAEGGAVVAFQNGLDTEAAILAACGPDATLRGVVNYAGNAASLGHIHMTFFNGANHVGAAAHGNASAAAKARDVAALLSASQMPTEFSDDVQRHVWAKAIRNAALMPISALTGMDMAEVMEHPSSRRILEVMLDEQLAVAAKAGYAFDRKFRDDTIAYFTKAGHHMPSMYHDVINKRRSEIAFLNHRIAEVGEQHGVPVPYNRAVANLVICVDEVAARRKAKP